MSVPVNSSRRYGSEWEVGCLETRVSRVHSTHVDIDVPNKSRHNTVTPLAAPLTNRHRTTLPADEVQRVGIVVI